MATISLAVSGASFFRDRARLRLYPWLANREGNYFFADVEMDQVWIRIVNHGRRPIALRRVGLSFRCKRRFAFGPPHPPEPPLGVGQTTETHTQPSPPIHLEPLKEIVLNLELSHAVVNGHDFLECVWAEDLVKGRYYVDRFALWLLRRDIRRLSAERRTRSRSVA